MERKSAARVMTKPNIWDRLNGRLTLWSALSCQGLLFRIPRVAVNPVSEWSRLQPSVRRILTRRRNVCLRAPYPRDSVNPPWRDRKGVRDSERLAYFSDPWTITRSCRFFNWDARWDHGIVPSIVLRITMGRWYLTFSSLFLFLYLWGWRILGRSNNLSH